MSTIVNICDIKH